MRETLGSPDAPLARAVPVCPTVVVALMYRRYDGLPGRLEMARLTVRRPTDGIDRPGAAVGEAGEVTTAAAIGSPAREENQR